MISFDDYPVRCEKIDDVYEWIAAIDSMKKTVLVSVYYIRLPESTVRLFAVCDDVYYMIDVTKDDDDALALIKDYKFIIIRDVTGVFQSHESYN